MYSARTEAFVVCSFLSFFVFVMHSAFGPLFCRTRFFACCCCFVRFCFSFSLLSPGGALGAPDVGRLRRPVGISCVVVVFVCVPVAPGGALGAPDVGRLRRPVGFLVAVGLLLFVCPGLVGAFGVLWPG